MGKSWCHCFLLCFIINHIMMGFLSFIVYCPFLSTLISDSAAANTHHLYPNHVYMGHSRMILIEMLASFYSILD